MCAIAAKKSNYYNSISYFKQAIVCLSSVQSCRKIIVSNATNIDKEIIKIASILKIEIIFYPFNNFVFDENIPWYLAYYKLCALHFICNNYNFKRILIVDTDTIFIRKIDNIWDEAGDNIMLYELPYSIKHQDRMTFIREANEFLNSKKNYIYYGGEFVCGKKEIITDYINTCLIIYRKMVENNFLSCRGDEFIWSVAAIQFEIVNASPYVCRYWTGRSYEVSTNYYYSEIVLLHLPNEKDNGFIHYYKKVLKNKKNNLKTIIKIFHLPSYKKSLLKYNFLDIKKFFKKRKNKSV